MGTWEYVPLREMEEARRENEVRRAKAVVGFMLTGRSTRTEWGTLDLKMAGELLGNCWGRYFFHMQFTSQTGKEHVSKSALMSIWDNAGERRRPLSGVQNQALFLAHHAKQRTLLS